MRPVRPGAIECDGASRGQVAEEGVPEARMRDWDCHITVVRLEQHGRHTFLVKLPVLREVLYKDPPLLCELAAVSDGRQIARAARGIVGLSLLSQAKAACCPRP